MSASARRALLPVIGVALLIGMGGCKRQQAPVSETHQSSGPALTDAAAVSASKDSGSVASPLFVDVTRQSGIAFRHDNGAFGRKWLPETLGPGVVIFDADGDGRPDILFVNGTRFKGHPGKRGTMVFYHNEGGMHFVDETKKAGLALSAYCLGGAAGDLDNDGDEDL
ncbi:MAG TPA: VCBS repeat-containing protein, partial [Thermoanaerobaculia bacterium]|nr:VCBS repeat-containing protein [Thermoanaerobaculia bacterium]